MTLVRATGQTDCWDERGRPIACRGSGQDGELRPGMPWPRPRFVVAPDGVRDRLTGLTWLPDANHLEWPLTWREAIDAVAELCSNCHLGREDWRLPNRRELWSLISFADRNPALPSGHPFRNVFLGWYWSSTSAARNPAYAWAVQLTGGRVFFESKDRGALVWPCRGSSEAIPATGQQLAYDVSGRVVVDGGGGQDGGTPTGVVWPRPRFTVRAGAVEDRLTGLWWSAAADLCPGPATWTEALAAVRHLDRGPSDDRSWRLPTITELESLLDARECDPSLPADHPFKALGAGYWSSTTSSYETDWAMVLHLDRGAIGVGIKSDRRFLTWPVSGPRES